MIHLGILPIYALYASTFVHICVCFSMCVCSRVSLCFNCCEMFSYCGHSWLFYLFFHHRMFRFFFILLTLRMMLYQTSVSMSPCAHMPLFMVGAFKILIDTAKIQSTIFQQMLEKLFANQTMAFVWNKIHWKEDLNFISLWYLWREEAYVGTCKV